MISYKIDWVVLNKVAVKLEDNEDGSGTIIFDDGSSAAISELEKCYE
jgi:hypothetical protein